MLTQLQEPAGRLLCFNTDQKRSFENRYLVGIALCLKSLNLSFDTLAS